jgi:hypothetical protein
MRHVYVETRSLTLYCKYTPAILVDFVSFSCGQGKHTRPWKGSNKPKRACILAHYVCWLPKFMSSSQWQAFTATCTLAKKQREIPFATHVRAEWNECLFCSSSPFAVFVVLSLSLIHLLPLFLYQLRLQRQSKWPLWWTALTLL